MLEILPQLIVSGILIGGVYGLMSIGLTLIFGVLRVVNFAQGEFIMLAMFGSFWMHYLWGIDPYLSALVLAPAIFVLGLLTERIVIQRILHAPHAMQIFATFGLSVDSPESRAHPLRPRLPLGVDALHLPVLHRRRHLHLRHRALRLHLRRWRWRRC